MYAAFGCLGFLLAGLGAILPELRAERNLPRSEAALYPSAFALGLIVVGLFGHRLAARLGRYALPSALTALVGGAGVLVLGDGRLLTGTGALILGLGGAALVQLVRAASARIVRLGHDRVLIGATVLGLAGFALFWTVGTAAVAVGGLFVTGLGVALLYPLILAEALAASPGDPVRASARSALGSGVAIATGPPLLGALADLTSLRIAALLAPVFLMVLLFRRTVLARTTDPRAPRTAVATITDQ
jgi:fucose permease